MTRLVDAHLHFQDLDPALAQAILESGREVLFFCNGIVPADWPAVAAFAEQSSRVFPFFGVHPWAAEKAGTDWEPLLRKRVQSLKSGIGEIGLDKAKKEVEYGIQKKLFFEQASLACELGKPFSIHGVRAWGDLVTLLERLPAAKPVFMMHSFSGPEEILNKLVKMGAYLSVSWKKLKTGTEDAERLVSQIPIDRLLIETDYPYVGKEFSERVSDPAFYFEILSEAYGLAASLKKMTVEHLAGKVRENAEVFMR